MLQSAWHERIPLLEEERRYENLLYLHYLTCAWTDVLTANAPKEDFRLERFVPPDLTQDLWLLEKLRFDRLPPDLERIVDETSVKETLDHLEKFFWSIQIALLDNVAKNIQDELQKNLVFGRLETASFGEGRRRAKELWSAQIPLQNAKHAWIPLSSGPFGAWLLLRASDGDLELLWKGAPISRPEVAPFLQATRLQTLHEEWVRGFLYGLDSQMRIEFELDLTSPNRWVRSTIRQTGPSV
jgi:hypothetical protein